MIKITILEKDIVEWFLQLKKYRKIEPELEVTTQKEVHKKDLREYITVAAYFLSQNELSYNELCWMLAEKQLIIQKGDEHVFENDIRNKAAQIFSSDLSYDELCWLIAELNILVDKKYLEIG
ncbi:MAG: hypothetical protein ACFFHV_05945 [Promethearchaeota archaeon]